MIQTYPTYYTPISTKRTVTTVTEYDGEGRVVKVTTTEETVDTTPSYQYPTTWNNDKFYITNVSDQPLKASSHT